MMSRLFLPLLVLFLFGVSGARAEDTPQRVVDRALATYREMTADPDYANLNRLLQSARAVIVVPTMYKGGFIIGGEWGRGVLLARDMATGLWSPPAFVTLTSGSIGLQIGGSVSQIVLVVMTEAGLNGVLKDKITLGAGVSIAAGPVGTGVTAQSSSDVNDDIYAYAKSKGLFAGVAIEGAVLETDADRNRFYYGSPYSPRQIVQQGLASNPGADRLRAALAGG